MKVLRISPAREMVTGPDGVQTYLVDKYVRYEENGCVEEYIETWRVKRDTKTDITLIETYLERKLNYVIV